MSDYLRIVIEFEGQAGRESARVLRSMMVDALIHQVCQHYKQAPQGMAAYHLANGHKRLLVASRTLGQNDVPDNGTLVFQRGEPGESPTRRLIEQNFRMPFESTIFVCIALAGSDRQFTLSWQPAIIGRKDTVQPQRNTLLAVDLSGVAGGNRVSRHHACITRKRGQYYLESINDRNPTYLDNMRLTPWQRQPIQPGSRITVGGITLIFKLTE